MERKGAGTAVPDSLLTGPRKAPALSGASAPEAAAREAKSAAARIFQLRVISAASLWPAADESTTRVRRVGTKARRRRVCPG